MNPQSAIRNPQWNSSRRHFLQSTSSGFGFLAFSALSTWASEESAIRNPQSAISSPLAPKQPHFAPRAKRVIFLCMKGAPSHVDTFDYKPQLIKDNGKDSGRGRGGPAILLAPGWKFSQRGRSGMWISDLFSETAKHADDLCVINSMNTDVPAHPQAFVQMHTGSSQFIRPSLGAWALYGLGTQNQNLPGFITMDPPPNNGGARNYGSSFLPAIYQGTKIGNGLPPLLARRMGGSDEATFSNIKNPRFTTEAQRTQLNFIQTLNHEKMQQDGYNPEVEGVIESYELAFRMQNIAPQVLDTSKETEATKKLYGIGDQTTDAFGKQCLHARRMIEAGVRFVEISQGNWDHHRNLHADLEKSCNMVDKPIAGLLTDLKARGLLKDTLVIWGGEFGRTPMSEKGDGRDHNPTGFSLWLAGGGVRGGQTIGATDDFGLFATEDRLHVHDLHATFLWLLGLDNMGLVYRHKGRPERPTLNEGEAYRKLVS